MSAGPPRRPAPSSGPPPDRCRHPLEHLPRIGDALDVLLSSGGIAGGSGLAVLVNPELPAPDQLVRVRQPVVELAGRLLAAGRSALGDTGFHPQLTRFDCGFQVALLLGEGTQAAAELVSDTMTLPTSTPGQTIL
jgi:hypothetical protein